MLFFRSPLCDNDYWKIAKRKPVFNSLQQIIDFQKYRRDPKNSKSSQLTFGQVRVVGVSREKNRVFLPFFLILQASKRANEAEPRIYISHSLTEIAAPVKDTHTDSLSLSDLSLVLRLCGACVLDLCGHLHPVTDRIRKGEYKFMGSLVQRRGMRYLLRICIFFSFSTRLVRTGWCTTQLSAAQATAEL